MPDLFNRRERDFSAYDQMTDEQLCQILRSDAKQEGCDDADMELILHVMEVLAKRREDRNEQKDPVKALESFEKNYADDDSAGFELKYVDAAVKKKHGKRWKPALAAAAAALVIVICGTVPVGASGENIAQIVGKWTRELFYFAPADTTVTGAEDTMPYAQLQDLLGEYDVDVAVPRWLPEEYELYDTSVREHSDWQRFTSSHLCGEKLIHFTIAEYDPENPLKVHQGGGLIELYERGGTEYYIYANNARHVASWIDGEYECHLAGPVTVEEIKKIIDSIDRK